MGRSITVGITSPVLARFPAVTVAAFGVTGLREFDAAGLLAGAEEIRRQLQAEGLTIETILQDRRIAQWRDALRACGIKASDFRGSAEQLVRRTLRGEEIEAPPMVRFYCEASARNVAPLGAYDADRLPGNVVELREARPDDRFTPLGGRAEEMPLRREVIVYACGPEVVCWAFNVRDSALTSLSAQTDNALFVSEAVTDVHVDASVRALRELRVAFINAGLSPTPIAMTDGMPEIAIEL